MYSVGDGFAGPPGPPGVCSCNLTEMLNSFSHPDIIPGPPGIPGIDGKLGAPGSPVCTYTYTSNKLHAYLNHSLIRLVMKFIHLNLMYFRQITLKTAAKLMYRNTYTVPYIKFQSQNPQKEHVLGTRLSKSPQSRACVLISYYLIFPMKIQ